jgi:hypothetical protein
MSDPTQHPPRPPRGGEPTNPDPPPITIAPGGGGDPVSGGLLNIGGGGLDVEPLDDGLGLSGAIVAYERPDGMDLETFLHAPASELPSPVASGTNILLNGFYVNLLNLMVTNTTDPTQVAGSWMGLGTGTLTSGVSRTDTGLVTEWKRYQVIPNAVSTSDPPNVTFSYFSPASDGAASITEVGMVTASSGGTYLSHSAFSYSKPANQDVRFDYTLTRILT